MSVTAKSQHKAELRLEGELTRLARRVRTRAALSGLFSTLSVAAAAGATMALVYPLLAVRPALLALAALGSLGLVVWCTVRLVLAPLCLRFPLDRLVSAVESRNPDLRERLSTALYLYRSDEVDKFGFSSELVRATVAFAEARADLGELRQGFSWRPVVYPLVWCAMFLLVWGGLLFARDRWVAPAVAGYRHVLVGTFPAEPPLRFSTSGDLYVRKGAATAVEARVLGRPAAKLLLQLVGPDGKPQLLSGEIRGPSTSFQVPPLGSDYQYRVFCDGHFSGVHNLTLLTPPRIVRWDWKLTPPAYTGLPMEKVSTPSRRIAARAGSWGDVSAQSNWPLSRVETAGGLLNLTLSSDAPRTLSGAMEFSSAAPVVVTLHDVFGQVASETLEVSLIPDAPPEVVLSFPPRLWTPPDKEASAHVDWAASDDYAIASATLVFRINASETHEQRVALYGAGIAAGTVESTTNGMRGGYAWDLAPLRLLPGDEVNYWVEATDNRPAPDGPNLARSEVHVLRLPSLLEQYSNEYTSEAAHVESMENLLEQQKAISERVKQIKESLEDKERNIMLGRERPESAWEEEKALEEVKKDQEALQRQMDRMREQMENSLTENREERERTLRTEEKQKKIKELLNQLLDDKAKAQLNQLQQAVQELARQMDARNLEALQVDMEQYEQELDRALSQLENLYTERQVDDMLQRAEELAEAQREITERTADAKDLGEESKSKDELAKQEEFLKQELEDVAKQLEELAERNADKNPERSEMLQKAAEELRESGVTNDVQQALEKLRSEQFEESLDSQKNAQGKLDKMASNMQDLQNAMGGPDLKMDIAKVGAVARRALYLSHRHEETVVKPLYDFARLSNWAEAGQQKISRDLDTYRAETARLAVLLDEAMRDVPFVDNRAGEALAAALRNFRQGIHAAEDEMPASAQPNAIQSLRFLNETVRELLDSLSQMQQMQQPGGQGGQEQMMQQMEQMAQRQRGLNQRMDRLRASPREKPGWQEMMDRMADEQKAMQKEMEGMAEQFDKSKELLGDMGKVAEEMKEAEDMLRQHNPDDPKLKEKQEHILEKLLEGGKSLKEDEYKKERESEVAKQYPQPEILDRPAPGRDLQRTLLRRAEGMEDENLTPRLRAPASNYFKNLAEEL